MFPEKKVPVVGNDETGGPNVAKSLELVLNQPHLDVMSQFRRVKIHEIDGPCKNASRMWNPFAFAIRFTIPHSTVQPSDVRMRADQPRHSLFICGSQKDVQRLNLTNGLWMAL
jgi:hypothetical protein